jgi:hypothetical protein
MRNVERRRTISHVLCDTNCIVRGAEISQSQPVIAKRRQGSGIVLSSSHESPASVTAAASALATASATNASMASSGAPSVSALAAPLAPSHRRTSSSAGVLQQSSFTSSGLQQQAAKPATLQRSDSVGRSMTAPKSATSSTTASSKAIALPNQALIVKLSHEPPATIQVEFTNLFKRLSALTARNRKLEEMVSTSNQSFCCCCPLTLCCCLL